MSGGLDRMMARSAGTATGLRPRPAARFETARGPGAVRWLDEAAPEPGASSSSSAPATGHPPIPGAPMVLDGQPVQAGSRRVLDDQQLTQHLAPAPVDEAEPSPAGAETSQPAMGFGFERSSSRSGEIPDGAGNRPLPSLSRPALPELDGELASRAGPPLHRTTAPRVRTGTPGAADPARSADRQASSGPGPEAGGPDRPPAMLLAERWPGLHDPVLVAGPTPELTGSRPSLAEPSVIEVTIGRLDVRAAATVRQPAQRPAQQPAHGEELRSYLRSRARRELR